MSYHKINVVFITTIKSFKLEKTFEEFKLKCAYKFDLKNNEMENYIFYIFSSRQRINITNHKEYFKLIYRDESIEDVYFELKKNNNEVYIEKKIKYKIYNSEQEEINFLQLEIKNLNLNLIESQNQLKKLKKELNNINEIKKHFIAKIDVFQNEINENLTNLKNKLNCLSKKKNREKIQKDMNNSYRGWRW